MGPIPRLHMLGAVLDLFLHQIEDLRCDDGLVVLFYIVLGDFPFIHYGLFGKEIGNVVLLQQCITLVLHIGQDMFDR
ncbi:hypothetical protein SDC9_204040 [bioreactor metagenome]|uniref:Uncharacterized protein n=1 Tax=bioreactor metagenome TaxID=1076179 RepID=A0A645IZQ5_9ZZZZ